MADGQQVLEDERRGFNGWRKRAIVKVGKKLRRHFDKVIARYSDIPTSPIIPNDVLPWARPLEENWQVIRGDLLRMLEERDRIPPLASISPDHRKIARGDEWRSFFFWAYGNRIDENCARCPDTARLVDAIPDLVTAFFSILDPGSHIPPHRGVTKAIFNSHLGLIVPADAEKCWIEIDGVRHGWSEGRLMAFDDTYRHEVRNQTDAQRVVLLVQTRRPVRYPGKLAADVFLGGVRHSPFIGDGMKNLARWGR